jgi:hypothetical protein
VPLLKQQVDFSGNQNLGIVHNIFNVLYTLFITKANCFNRSCITSALQLSAVNTHVPVLDVANYQEWAPQMQAFLQTSGIWCIVNGTITCPTGTSATNVATATAWDISDDTA